MTWADVARGDPLPARRSTGGPLNRVPAFIGTRSLAFFRYVGALTYLFHDALWWTFVAPFRGKGKINYLDTLHQIEHVSVRAFGIVAMVNFCVGMILAFQMAYILKTLGVSEYTADITAIAMVREMGPLIVSVIMTGYMGAAITAELGSMTVSEEILALEVMALNPIRLLVVPRVLAAMIMVPLVCLVAVYIGIAGGLCISYLLLEIGVQKYFARSFDAIHSLDVVTGLIKVEAFAILIALIACHEGFSARGGLGGVGKATTNSVVRSIVAIILCDLVFTALFFFF